MSWCLQLTIIESNELVNGKEISSYLPDLSSHLLRLHRLRHLLRRHRGNHPSLWRLPSSRNARSDSLRRWLWFRSYDMVPYVRDSSIRPQSNLYRHFDRLRILPIRSHLRQELWHAPRFPILDWIFRLSCLGYWRCFIRRYVQARQTCLCHRYMGLGSYLRSSVGSLDWWICSSTQGMEMAYLGTPLAVWILVNRHDPLPPRNQLRKYPLSSNTPSP